MANMTKSNDEINVIISRGPRELPRETGGGGVEVVTVPLFGLNYLTL